MFYGCTSLTNLPNGLFSNKLTIKYTELCEFCYNCTSLTSLPEDFIIPDNILKTDYMFCNCTRLSSLNDTFILPTILQSSNFMFFKCTSLTDVSSGCVIPQKIILLSAMFYNCNNLSCDINKILPEDGFIQSTYQGINMDSTFYDCKKLTGFAPYYNLWDASYIIWDPINSTNKPYAFKNCSGLINYEYIPINWGGLGQPYKKVDIEVDVEAGDIIRLPIHKNYKTYNYETGDEYTLNSYYNFTVDWGDQTPATIVVCDGTQEDRWLNQQTAPETYLSGYPITYKYETYEELDSNRYFNWTIKWCYS